MSAIFDKTVDALSKVLDLSMMRHRLIADNIANAETPGFKARRLDFEAELERAIELGNNGASDRSSALNSVRPQIYEDPENEVGGDLNTVDMDREMSALSKNDVKFSASSQALTKKFALLKYVIQGGS